MQSDPLPPRRLLLWLSAAVVVLGTALALLGAFQTGATRDENYHVARFDNYLHHGVYAPSWALGSDDSTAAGENTSVYAPVTSLLLHAGSVLAGQEGWGSVSMSAGAYDSRHVGVVLIGLIGTAAAAGIVRLLLGSWRWGLVCAAVLLALPMWTGLLMFNVKDVPVATGYTLVTLALVAMATAGLRRWQRCACLFAGVVLMVGTRPAMVSAVVVGVLVLLGAQLLFQRARVREVLIEVAVVGVVSFGLLLLIYPRVFGHLSTLVVSGQKSAHFRGGGTTPVGYVPFFLSTQTPLLLLLFSLLGLVPAVRGVLRRDARSIGLLLVGTQLLALPLIAIVTRGDLYNGLRQLLFYAPAWAILATLGIAFLRHRLVAVVAALALVAPMVDQVIEQPYQYTYLNPALDALVGHHRPYGGETDYWRASARELLDKVPTDGQVICGPYPRNGLAGRYSVGPGRTVDCRVDPIGPLAPYWKAAHRPLGDTLPHTDFYAVIDNDYPVPPNCTRLSAVTRPRHGRTITMLYVARCSSGPLPPLSGNQVWFTPTAAHPVTAGFWSYLPQGWVNNGATAGIDVGEQRSVIAFRAPADCAKRTGCTLVVQAQGVAPGRGQVSAAVNGRPVEVTATSSRLLIPVPAGTPDTWVVLRSAPGDLKVSGIRLVRRAPAPR